MATTEPTKGGAGGASGAKKGGVPSMPWTVPTSVSEIPPPPAAKK